MNRYSYIIYDANEEYPSELEWELDSKGDWVKWEDVKALSVKLEAAEQERDIAQQAAAEWRTRLAEKMVEASRGEVVKACPLCDAHNLSWDDEGACWFCVECGQHIDEVYYWQKVKGPQL